MAAVRKSPARGRLSREMIEDAAFEVIDAEGLDGFSTRKVAAVLGCEAMSIYHHFPSKAHLFEALVDRLVGPLRVPSDELPWRVRVRTIMEDFRSAARSHPAFAPYFITYRMNSPTCLAWLDGVIGVFQDGGFGEEKAARLFRAIGYYLMGAVLDETAGYAKGPSAVATVSAEELAGNFPKVASAGKYFAPAEFDATFKIGIDMLLDEMERERGERTGR